MRSLGGSEVHDLWSEAVNDTYRVFIGHCGPDPEAILVVTDANGLFGLTVDTVRLMQIPQLVPSLVVVGIGYPDADRLIDTVDIRVRDFTPTARDLFAGSGHADEFAAFIRAELQPWLANRFPTAVEDLTYFGHSLGGLFGTYLLLSDPTPFERFVLSSPSLWWDDEMIFDLERKTAAQALRSDVFFGIGALETDAGRRLEAANLAPDHPAKPPPAHLDMVSDLRRFIARLTARSHGDTSLAGVEVDGEFHATVVGTVLSRALRHFYV